MIMIGHYAGSSASPIVTASQLGWKADIARVQGLLHMRTLTQYYGGDGECHSRLRTRVTMRALVAWESHLRDASERPGGGGRVEGMHKKGQMVPLVAWWPTRLYRGFCELDANKHSHNTIVTTGLRFNKGAA